MTALDFLNSVMDDVAAEKQITRKELESGLKDEVYSERGLLYVSHANTKSLIRMEGLWRYNEAQKRLAGR